MGKKQDLLPAELCEAYYRTFNTGFGEMVLEDLRVEFLDRTTFIQGDPYHTHVNEGARIALLYILDQIERFDSPEKGRVEVIT